MYKGVGGYCEASCCHDVHGVQQMALGRNTQFTYIYWSEGVGLPKSSSLVHSFLCTVGNFQLVLSGGHFDKLTKTIVVVPLTL